MHKHLRRFLMIGCATAVSAFALFAAAACGQTSLESIQKSFQSPPDDARIMMRWWWFGPCGTKPEIERELGVMKEAGIGGVELATVYPLALDGNGIKNFPFLSDEHIDAVRFAAEKARELGMRCDVTLGSGWPYGGPMVPIEHATSKLRVERVRIEAGNRRVPLPDIGTGEKLLAVFFAPVSDDKLATDSLRELTDIKDRVAWLPADLEGPREVIVFIASRTGVQVNRRCVGGEGFVLDHYNRVGTCNYLKDVGDRLMQAFKEQPPYAVFCDSLEADYSNWTSDLLDEFQKRRGYNLRPLLPHLALDMGPQSIAIRHDWAKTLTELFNDNFMAPMRDWAKEHGTKFRVQCYGIPPAALSSNALADLPEGEGSQWKTLTPTRWASSAGHLYGHPIISSETWTWLHSPSYRATLLDLKAEADLHFLQGINQLVGHGWPYSPPGIEYPGWRLYAAAALTEKNPWWIVMPELTAYCQRISSVLRQGTPVNDVALYLPNDDGWARCNQRHMELINELRDRLGPDVIPAILGAGFNFDFFDDEVLRQLGRMESGKLALGPNAYKAVILPNVERIPLDTLKKLDEYARVGGVLIATRRLPALAPGFQAAEAESQQICEISQRLFEGAKATGHSVKDERGQLGAKLAELVGPDMSLSPPVPEIGFLHRHTDAAEIYFVANTSNVPQRTRAAFRTENPLDQCWNPMDGSIVPARSEPMATGRTTVQLELEPYGSRVLVFAHYPAPLKIRAQQATATPAAPPALDLIADWQVSFGPGGTPKPMDKLRSWTTDEETRYFSGLATYEKKVAVPPSMLQPELDVFLDFGEGRPSPPSKARFGMSALYEPPVAEAAVVYVNGQRAGAVWCPPYAVNVTKFLRPGENQLRIVVGNTPINYMAGRSLPDYRLLNMRYGERFKPQDMDNLQPVPSGLLGSVQLRAEAAKLK